MKEIIKINSTPAMFTADFEKAEEILSAELKKYDVVVTIDTVKDAKSLATELNKMATDINSNRIAAVKTVSAPIREFEEKMKLLSQKCKDGRESILTQVRAFEVETEKEVERLLTKLREDLFIEVEVSDEFKRAEFDDLIRVSNITEKGKLGKRARDALTSRVRDDKALQDKTGLRLLQLENTCFKAGLKVPLERVHVEAFLFADDEVYKTRLDSMIYVEVKRQEKAEEKVREQVKKETPAPIIETGGTYEKEYVSSFPEVKDEPVVAASVAQSAGNVVRVVVATFEIEVPESIPDERITNKLTKMLTDAGITSMTSIVVQS